MFQRAILQCTSHYMFWLLIKPSSSVSNVLFCVSVTYCIYRYIKSNNYANNKYSRYNSFKLQEDIQNIGPCYHQLYITVI
jgi:hypothetical protein